MCNVLLFLCCTCPQIGQGKNGHFISDSNLGYVTIIQEIVTVYSVFKTTLNKMYGWIKFSAAH